MPLRLTLTSADALAVALSHIRPALRVLGPDAVAEIDGARFTITGSLPGGHLGADPTPLADQLAAEEAAVGVLGLSAPEPVEAVVARVLAEPAPFVAAVAAVAETAAESPAPTRVGKAGNPQHTPWTADDDAKVAELWNDGATAEKIAAALSRTYGAVVQRMVLLKERGVQFAVHGPGGCGDGPSVPWTQEQDARLLSMRASGATFSEIGSELGRSAGACRLRAKKLETTATPEAPVALAPEPQPEPEPGFRTMRGATFPTLPPSPLVAVTEAIREVKGAEKPIIGRLPAIEPARSTKPGTSDLRRKIAAHLDRVGATDFWTPLRDLELVEGACAGNFKATARRMRVAEPDALARFKLLCRPIILAPPRKGNSTEGQIVLVELLRERAAETYSLAAE